ncbi:AI-2E family transporter [Methylorubrum extorquens]|nr:AI-2E family transporter [Methylorubrum extorquens]
MNDDIFTGGLPVGMSNTNRNRLLGVIAVILGIGALRASYSVTMPLAAAAVVIAAVWPVKTWADRYLPAGLGYAATVATLAVVFAAFTVAVYFCAAQVVFAFERDWDRFNVLYLRFAQWGELWGWPLDGQEAYGRLIGAARGLLQNVYATLAYLGFIALLVTFGLPEVPALRIKLRETFTRDEQRKVLEAVEDIAVKTRQYLGISTLTSLLTGVATTLLALAVGLDLALVWGVLNFLLNYIPVVGNVIGILPPSLYAFMQFQTATTPAFVLVGLTVIQLAISNVVYPMLQGRSLSLSPLAIIVALSFWSWVWGIAGAILAVPLSSAIVIACEAFPSTRWIARLLSEPEERKGWLARRPKGGGRQATSGEDGD